MLIDFQLRNFRSFAKEQNFSLVASRRLGDDFCEHAFKIPNTEERLLRAGVVWGSNGAGKSNLFKAMRLAASLVLSGNEKGRAIPVEPFAFSEQYRNAPTSFEFRFVAEGSVYRYGFSADSERVHEEWLMLQSGNAEKVLFERELAGGDDHLQIGRILSERVYPRIVALGKVGVRANQLFLAAIRDSIPVGEYGALVSPVIDWFENQLTFVGVGDRFHGLAEFLASDRAFAEFAGEFLKRAGTGVNGLDVETFTLDDGQLKSLGFDPGDIDVMMARAGNEADSKITNFDGSVMSVEKGEGAKVTVRRINTEHQSGSEGKTNLPLSEASDGTLRLLHLIPALYLMKDTSRVFVIDELDRSLHPNLSREFLKFFLQSCRGQCRQMVVTTHEDRLLDLELLRRDEIWFVEKDSDGASSLRSLSEFKIRRDLKIDKGYLNGRFGGVPQLGQLFGLMPDISEGIEHKGPEHKERD